MSTNTLTTQILALSVSSIWNDAKLEWQLEEVIKDETPRTCLCGHSPILEICKIRNTKNNNTAIVGNCCVKRFTDLPSQKIFQAVARVQKDWWRTLNAETIKYAHHKGWITAPERQLYLDTIRKQIQSMPQNENMNRNEINQRILQHILRKNSIGGQPAEPQTAS